MKIKLGVWDSNAMDIPEKKEDCGCCGQGGAWEEKVGSGWS